MDNDIRYKVKIFFQSLVFPALFVVASYLTTVVDLDPVVGMLIVDVLFSAVFIRWYLMRQKTDSKTEQHKVNVTVIFLFLVLLVVLWYVLSNTIACFRHYYTDTGYSRYREAIGETNSYLYMLLTLIIAPVCEEFLIRDHVYVILSKGFSRIATVVMSSLMFAVLHGTLTHLNMTLMFGIFMCFVLEVTGNIWFCVGFHALYNFISQMYARQIPVNELFYNVPFTVMLNLILYTCLFILYFHAKEFRRIRQFSDLLQDYVDEKEMEKLPEEKPEQKLNRAQRRQLEKTKRRNKK